MIAKKKQILTATLVVALAAAVAVNWYYTKPEKSAEEGQTTQVEQVNLGDSLLVAGSVQQTTQESSDETTTEAQQESSSEYFAQAKLKKQQSHDEIKDEIEDLMNNTSLSTEEKAKVTSILTAFQNAVKSETDAENLITAKTGSDCVVIINNDSAQVIMQNNTLNEAVLLQITEIIEKNTNISAENLTIIEAK